MKILLLIFSVMFASLAHHANCQSMVSTINDIPKAGVENYFVYRPEKGMQVPDSLQIVAIYLHDQNFHIKTFVSQRFENRYFFHFGIPDSTSIMIFCVTKVTPLNKFDFSVETNSIIDNNSGRGFVIPLYNREGNSFDFENIDKATLLYHFAPSRLKLKETSKNQLINWYEHTFQKYPHLKESNDFDFHYYLDLLFKQKGDVVKHVLLEYAKSIEKNKKSERKWIWAAKTYGILGMSNGESRVEKEIIAAYPTGDVAKKDFWRNFYSTGRLTLSEIDSSMQNYVRAFNDTSSISKDRFYIQLISLFLKKEIWDSLPKYESLISNKISLANLYGNFALHLYSDQLDTSIYMLDIARTLSQKAIHLIKNRISDPVADDYSNIELQSLLNHRYDTYAQILFKLGNYDSAFYYQNAIYKQPLQLSQKQIERYVLYSEKARGMQYTSRLIED